MTANVPRVDYSGGGCPSLLLEKQSTNLVSYSEQFDNAWWTKGNGSITANATTSPDGTTNADKFAEDSTNNNHYFGDDTTTATSGQLVTFTIFAKASERSWIAMRIYNGSGSVFGWYNIESGTLGTIGGGGIASITAMGNGWYRCALTVTMASSSVFLPYVFSSTGDTVLTYTGTSGSGFFVWGAQAEISSYATSYIPTLSAASTRGSDFGSASNTIGTSYASSDFSYFIEFNLFEDSGVSNSPMLFGGGNAALGASYQGYLRIGLSGTNTMSLFGHGDLLMASVVYAFTKATRYKLLVKRSGTSIKFYVNGAQVGTTGTSSLDFTLRSIGWSYAANTYSSYGNIIQFLAFQSSLTDTQAIELTTL
jgi:hypothetical protein